MGAADPLHWGPYPPELWLLAGFFFFFSVYGFVQLNKASIAYRRLVFGVLQLPKELGHLVIPSPLGPGELNPGWPWLLTAVSALMVQHKRHVKRDLSCKTTAQTIKGSK